MKGISSEGFGGVLQRSSKFSLAIVTSSAESGEMLHNHSSVYTYKLKATQGPSVGLCTPNYHQMNKTVNAIHQYCIPVKKIDPFFINKYKSYINSTCLEPAVN